MIRYNVVNITMKRATSKQIPSELRLGLMVTILISGILLLYVIKTALS